MKTEGVLFGDLIKILENQPDLILVVGVNDTISKTVETVVAKTKLPYLFLNYDKNKSLMLDLNIRRVPVVLFFKNMDMKKAIHPPVDEDKIITIFNNLND